MVQDAYQIGYQGIKALNAVISGQTVAKEIDIPVKYVNAQNINTLKLINCYIRLVKNKEVYDE